MHMLWQKGQTDCFWLYVRQARNFRLRIIDHNDPKYRRRHPCLHYHVWDALDEPESVFIGLAVISSVDPETLGYVLNLAEMWMACVFQTLRRNDLERFLPEGTPVMWAGQQLNVALPLWQRFPGEELMDESQMLPGRESFSDLLFSENPTIRQWASETRDAFNDLRDSPNPHLRQYYRDQINASLNLARKATQQKKFLLFQDFLERGMETTVRKSGRKLYVAFSVFNIPLNQYMDLPLNEGDTVHIQPYITQTPNPMRYAVRAQETDPSSPLLLRLKAKHKNGYVRAGP
ncbi:hypothetical protein BDV59DRAFT_209145 [Aspergillus ambiguus]|uniref:uncharacterized protein n=1 Tax=Aspergillus ambiguus TaxID=176160 RepID=UPI003CCE4C15